MFLIIRALILASTRAAGLPVDEPLSLPLEVLHGALLQAEDLEAKSTTPIRRFLFRCFCLLLCPGACTLLFVQFMLTNLERFYQNIVLRFYLLISNFMVKFCLPLLSYYALFGLFIFLVSAIIRHFANSLISFFVFPFIVLSAFFALFSCCYLADFLAVCLAIFFILFSWWLALQLADQQS